MHVLSGFSHVWLFVTTWTIACQAPLSWDSPGMNTEGGCHALLQGIFLTEELNPWLLCLLHWKMCSLILAPPGKAKCSHTTNVPNVLLGQYFTFILDQFLKLLEPLIQFFRFGQLIYFSAHFSNTYATIGTIQRKLALSLHKNNVQIYEEFCIFT